MTQEQRQIILELYRKYRNFAPHRVFDNFFAEIKATDDLLNQQCIAADDEPLLSRPDLEL